MPNSRNKWLPVPMHEQSLLIQLVCWPFLSYFTGSYYMIHLDATIEYSPNNIIQTLNQINNRLETISNCVWGIDQRTEVIDGHIATINRRMTSINETLAIGHALTANLRIVNRNTRLQQLVEPLRKTVCHSVALCSFNQY